MMLLRTHFASARRAMKGSGGGCLIGQFLCLSCFPQSRRLRVTGLRDSILLLESCASCEELSLKVSKGRSQPVRAIGYMALSCHWS